MARTVKANVFRDLLLFEHELDTRLSRGFATSDDKLEYDKARELYSTIENLLYGYKWTQSKNLILRIDTYLNLDCDFKKFSSVIKDREGFVTNGALETSIWRASTLFKDFIGKNTVDLLKQFRLKDAETELYISIGKLSIKNLTSDVVVSHLPDAKKLTHINLVDCRNELKILKGLSRVNIENVFSKLDKDKLSYIRYILEESDTTLAKERSALYDFLRGVDYSLDDIILVLRAINLGVDG